MRLSARWPLAALTAHACARGASRRAPSRSTPTLSRGLGPSPPIWRSRAQAVDGGGRSHVGRD
eukprot:scaffold34705_cov90-Phaeocystis_antarctica.AAC.1